MEDFVTDIGWTLVHFLWQGTAIAVLHYLLLRSLTGASPGLRYHASLISLFAVAVTPVITFAKLRTSATAAPVSSPAEPHFTAYADVQATLAASNNGFSIELLLPYIVAIWLVGVMLLMSRFVLGILSARNLVRLSSRSSVPSSLVETVEELRAVMRIGQRVRLAVSDLIDSPLVVGWLQPVILLPASAITGLAPEQLRMILAHELAHVRRLDYLVNLLQVVVETFLFYHPATHWISKSIRIERERCCDDVATAIAGDRIGYARLLATLEEMRHTKTDSSLALGMVDHTLYDRIHRLVRHEMETVPARSPWLPASIILIAVAFLVAQSENATQRSSFSDSITQVLPLPDQRITIEETPAKNSESDMKPEEWATSDVGSDGAGVSVEPARNVPVPSNRTDSSVNIATVAPKKVDVENAVPIIQKTPPATASTAAEANALNQSEKRESPQIPAIREEVADVDVLDGARKAMDVATPADHEPVRSGGRLLSTVEPRYPQRALRSGREGFVTLKFEIDVNGNVRDVRVVTASPRNLFEDSAIEAVKQWRYEPFTEDGIAITREATQRLDFRLTSRTQAGRRGDECETRTGTRLCQPSIGNPSEVDLKIGH